MIQYPAMSSGRRDETHSSAQLAILPGATHYNILSSARVAHLVTPFIDAVWRIESARLIAGLARIVRDVGLAEELARESVLQASQSCFWIRIALIGTTSWCVAASPRSSASRNLQVPSALMRSRPRSPLVTLAHVLRRKRTGSALPPSTMRSPSSRH